MLYSSPGLLHQVRKNAQEQTVEAGSSVVGFSWARLGAVELEWRAGWVWICVVVSCQQSARLQPVVQCVLLVSVYALHSAQEKQACACRFSLRFFA